MNAQPLGLPLDVVLERLDQRLRLIRCPDALALQACDAPVGARGRVSGACQQEAQQIARRLARGERLLWQAGAEFALDAQHQLDTRQAVEPQLSLERAVERDMGVDI